MGLRDIIIKKLAGRVSDVSDEEPEVTEDIIHLIEKETVPRESIEGTSSLINFADDLTLSNEEIIDLVGKEAVPGEQTDHAVVLTNFLDEPSWNGRNIIDFIKKKNYSPDISDKADTLREQRDAPLPDDKNIIDLTGKEVCPEPGYQSAGMTSSCPDDKDLTGLMEKNIAPPESVDYDTSMLTNFLNEATMNDEYPVNGAENEIFPSEHTETIVNLNDFTVHAPDDDENTLDLTGKILSEDAEHIVDINDITADVFEDDADTIRERDTLPGDIEDIIELTDIAVEISEDDEDTIDVSEKNFSLQPTENLSELGGIAVEIIADKDAVYQSDKKTVPGEKNTNFPDDISNTHLSHDSRQETDYFSEFKGDMFDMEEEVGNLLEESDDLFSTENPGTDTWNAVPEEGYENLKKTGCYTENLEQMMIRKISQKIENMDIDERIIKKYFPKKLRE